MRRQFGRNFTTRLGYLAGLTDGLMSLSQAKICEGLTITYNSLLLKNGVDFSKGKTLFSLPSFAREGAGMELNPASPRTNPGPALGTPVFTNLP